VLEAKKMGPMPISTTVLCVQWLLCVADIIFCIYLYQRWIYRIDPKRVNEFGTSGEMLESPQASEGQNGTVPAIDSSGDTDEAVLASEAGATGDAVELPPEQKPKAEKKED